MKQALIKITAQEDITMKELYTSIQRRSRLLTKLTTKLTLLKMELSIIQHEYQKRIGRLYKRDDQLDLEIIHYKNILRLIKEGLSLETALKKLQDKFYASENTESFSWHYGRQQFTSQPREESIPEEKKLEVKKLWRDLLFKLHPDLVMNREEKKRREILMKKLNKAYANFDVLAIEAIADSCDDLFEEVTAEKLERQLTAIEKQIAGIELEKKMLRKTEWYSWKRKKERGRKTIDVFQELEEQLVSDIAKKVDILSVLKKKVNIL